ncbi:hypothetical protein V6N11_065375 [Hibiscus sabdariffa]|uniref:Uncharacterized protein n=1 Tax=Hibiscus sabdariffa TaxID=183260 RepID=A0ABR2QGR1_9ROSI
MEKLGYPNISVYLDGSLRMMEKKKGVIARNWHPGKLHGTIQTLEEGIMDAHIFRVDVDIFNGMMRVCQIERFTCYDNYATMNVF